MNYKEFQKAVKEGKQKQGFPESTNGKIAYSWYCNTFSNNPTLATEKIMKVAYKSYKMTDDELLTALRTQKTIDGGSVLWRKAMDYIMLNDNADFLGFSKDEIAELKIIVNS